MSNVMVGIRLALRAWPLTALNYAIGLLLALVGALPFYVLWGRALAERPAGDALLGGLQLMVIAEIGQYDRNSSFALVLATALGVLAAGMLTGALTAGGNFEVLLTTRDDRSDPRPFFHRFFRGAGRFFGRNVRLMLLNLVVGLLVGGGVLAAVSAALKPLGDSMGFMMTPPWMLPMKLASAGIISDDRTTLVWVPLGRCEGMGSGGRRSDVEIAGQTAPAPVARLTAFAVRTALAALALARSMMTLTFGLSLLSRTPKR